MAMITRYGIEKSLNSMEGFAAYENGGKGSGNFGHSGRPGEVGGSAPSGSGASGSTKKYTKADQIKDQYKAGLITEGEMKGLLDKAEKDGSAKDEVKKPETKKSDNTKAMPNKKSQESATEWAKKNFTSGEQITDKDMSFDEVLARMVDGEDYYQFMGSDSVDREAMFSEMAKRTGLDYDDIYSAWMGDHSGQARRYIGELTRSPRYRELKQRDSAGFDAWRATGSQDKFLNPKERDERNLRDMVSSVWTYGGGKDSEYLHDGYRSLSDKERKKIIDDEWKYLDDNCTTAYAGEDSEGVTYRGIKYRPSSKRKNALEDILTDTIDKIVNGGKGSGNFGHEGRPGEVGGSAPTGGHGGSSDTKKTNPREGYGSRFAQAKIDDDDFALRTDDQKTMLSRIDEDTVRDTIAIRAISRQMGNQMWQGKLDDITDDLTRDYAKVQRHLAHQMDLITDEILDGATRRVAHYDPSEKDADAKMARFERDYKAYDAALTKYGDQVYQGATDTQAKMLKDNDKVLMKAHEKLGEAYRKFKAAEGEPTMTVDISDLVKPRR